MLHEARVRGVLDSDGPPENTQPFARETVRENGAKVLDPVTKARKDDRRGARVGETKGERRVEAPLGCQLLGADHRRQSDLNLQRLWTLPGGAPLGECARDELLDIDGKRGAVEENQEASIGQRERR